MKIETIATKETLENQITFLTLELNKRDEQITSLQEQLDWFKRQIFGKKSERIVKNLNEAQLMISGCEALEITPQEELQTVPAHQRRKPNRNGQDAITLPPDLPVETTVLDLPEEEKVCQETGVALVKIGEEVTRRLAHKTGSYFIKEIIRPKYAIPGNEEAGILIHELPSFILPKCRVDESVLAEIVTKKFADHLPLYRIAEIMGREGIGISRKLLSQWVIRLGLLLVPLYEVMLHKILKSNSIYIDESPVNILEKKKCRKGYMWTIVGGEGADPPYRIYDFRENRKYDNVEQMLFEYHGVLHSDKYGAYEQLAAAKKIIWCPCYGHMRRKFFEAEAGDPSFRDWMLDQFGRLFDLEQHAWQQSPEERLLIRQEQEVPIIDEMIGKVKNRLIDGKLLPKSKFKEALGYFVSLTPYLKNYTLYPNARLDNNVAERALRPLAIGRKNWLFFGSANGGQAAAVLLSLVQTCRGLNIDPRAYLEDLFRCYMDHPANRLEELLPDVWKLQS